MTIESVRPADDVLRGMDEIAAYIGVARPRAYRLVNQGIVPAGREGGMWIGSKAAITESYKRRTAGQAA